MPRKPIVRSSECIYHVTARCNNRDWYQTPLESVWGIYGAYFNQVIKKYDFRPISFVLMNNHFHLLLHTPMANIDLGMMWFMRQSSLAIGRASGRINKIYGSRYKPCVIADSSYFYAAYKYVYNNPVRAGICKSPYDYPWSTLNSKSVKTFDAPDYFNFELKQGLDQLLASELSDESCLSIQKALRKSEFKYPRSSSTKRSAKVIINDTLRAKKSAGTF